MVPKYRHRWIRIYSVASLVATALGLGCFALWLYSPARFRGDGDIRDTGFWSYPRYHIEFPEIALDKPGDYTFRASGLPPVPWTFQLKVAEGHEYDTLQRLRTNVAVRITDSRDRQLSQAAGPLHQWVLAWVPAAGTGGYWQPSGRDLSFSPFRTYSVHVSVGDIDPASPEIRARPALEGGGIELP